MSMSEPVISIRNLTKTYKLYDNPVDRVKEAFHPFRKKYFHPFNALSDISFDVLKGETIGIIGRNGAGKSTLLQILCKTITPTSGSVEGKGRTAALLELGSGFNPEFTGSENVYINAAIMGLSRKEIDKKYDKIIEFADIGDFINQPVKLYSSGMYVRLAFSVIVNVDADILIVDEALAVGDVFFVQKCMRFLREFIQKGGTLLFVSHDTSAVLNLCNRAIWLENGNIKGIGDAKDMCESYLETLILDRQEAKGSVNQKEDEAVIKIKNNTTIDQRLKFINKSKYRNDIELYYFDPLKSREFGAGGASIQNVELLDYEKIPLSWVVGGEKVVLKITCIANRHLEGVIVGFYVKDRLGQNLFGDNTYLSFMDNPIILNCGESLKIYFDFIMPILPVGNYSIAVAIAEGNQEDHVQHQWIHDALIFESHSSSTANGLIGIPISGIDAQICSKNSSDGG